MTLKELYDLIECPKEIYVFIINHHNLYALEFHYNFSYTSESDAIIFQNFLQNFGLNPVDHFSASDSDLYEITIINE